MIFPVGEETPKRRLLLVCKHWFVYCHVISLLSRCLLLQEERDRTEEVPGIEQSGCFRVYQRRKYVLWHVSCFVYSSILFFCLFGCKNFQNLCKGINWTFSLNLCFPPRVSFSRPLFYLSIFVFVLLAFLQ